MKNSNKWVQHISGQGEKWEVLNDRPPGLQDNFRPMEHHEWIVRARVGSDQFVKRWFALPKSEYRLCESPELWKDVTGECEVDSEGIITHHGIITVPTSGYRRRKVAVELRSSECYEPVKFAIIVEQKVSG